MDKKDYEISFLVKNPDGVRSIELALKQIEGEVIYQSPVAETRLAYPIKKERLGYFGFWHFRALPENAEKLQNILKLEPSVLRILIVTPPIKKMERMRRPVAVSGESRPAVESKPVEESLASRPSGALTNEALEAKLEEILK